ncbi:formyl-CoA transferase [Oceanicola sp. 22II-s10i]|uniref:CaiB/BaiF CoA transferase family protein n=1 Tax=Oceanicola sp. 22II-s10i TaxID=1317116 RepID=UPI000B52911D|nr:CoA transferase [Oceanicola sp. 22II-s10i]OWU84908.1 formyl-CoA transferase [Oceanicola sp. 22II-s10i]
MTDSAVLPLSGIRVIDLTQVYQGPYCTLLMAKAGADVIKVEPLKGEPIRIRQEVSRGSAVPFAMLNQNKRDMTLDLKSPEGKDILRRLVKDADVLVENYAPGVMDRLGLGFEALREINPRLVYASGSGYGITGPDKDRQAMDITVQAASGMMSVTGFPDGPPVKCGPAVIDFLSGTHLYGAIMTALFHRTRTGKGQLVEVAMQECVYPALASNLGMIYDTDAPPPRTGNRHGGLASCPYNVYPCSDGYVAIICTNETHFVNLCTAMGQPELASDPRFCDRASRVRNMDLTDATIGAWTGERPKAEVARIFGATKVPHALVRDLIEVTNDSHMHARGALGWVDHPEFGRIVVPQSPLRLHDAPGLPFDAAPSLGAHSRQVLAVELGYSEADIDRLEDEGVIARAKAVQAAE